MNQTFSVSQQRHSRPVAEGERQAPHFYRAFGLTIASHHRMDQLESVLPASPDLTIGLQPVAWPDGDRAAVDFRFLDQASYLHWDAVGTFKVTADAIDIDPSAGVDPRLIAFPLLGPVIALWLHLRGFFVLHASAVSVGGAAVVFLGDKGAGKSTTAATLIAAGHPFLSDDIVAIDLSGDEPSVLRAFPQLKLASDASAAIELANVEKGEQVHAAIPKIQHRLTAGYAETDVALGALYVLERCAESAVTRCDPSQALPLLVKFSYVTRFNRAALRPSAARHLAQCARLVRSVGVKRLSVPTGVEKLRGLSSIILADLRKTDAVGGDAPRPARTPTGTPS